MIPARFQVQRQVLNLLQYILQQPTQSLLYRIFKSLENHPTRKDWLSDTKMTLKLFEIQLTIREIQNMEPNKYKLIVKQQSVKTAFQYLLQKQSNSKKGNLITYEQVEMADYLLPEGPKNVSRVV